MKRFATMVVLTCLLGFEHAAAQSKDLKYSCTAKKKKGAGDAASVITAKSESAAVEEMKKRWPGFESYSCVLSR